MNSLFCAFTEPPPQIWIFVAGYKSLTCHLSSMQGLRFPFSLWSLKEVHSAFAPPDASNVGTGKIWSRAIKKSSAFKFRSRRVFRLNSPLLVWAYSFMAPIENLKTRHAKERSHLPIKLSNTTIKKSAEKLASSSSSHVIQPSHPITKERVWVIGLMLCLILVFF